MAHFLKEMACTPVSSGSHCGNGQCLLNVLAYRKVVIKSYDAWETEIYSFILNSYKIKRGITENITSLHK